MKLNPLALMLACAVFMPIASAGTLNPYDQNINGFAVTAIDATGKNLDNIVFCVAGSDADRQYSDEVTVLKFADRPTMVAAYTSFRETNSAIPVGWTNGQEQLAALRFASTNNQSHLATLILHDDNIPGKLQLVGESTAIIDNASDPLDQANQAVASYLKVTQDLTERGITKYSTNAKGLS